MCKFNNRIEKNDQRATSGVTLQNEFGIWEDTCST